MTMNISHLNHKIYSSFREFENENSEAVWVVEFRVGSNFRIKRKIFYFLEGQFVLLYEEDRLEPPKGIQITCNIIQNNDDFLWRCINFWDDRKSNYTFNEDLK